MVSGPAPFLLIGPSVPRTPVILSVPHAGRAYPPDIETVLRVPRRVMEMLEDRHADLLTAEAVRGGATVLVATVPRALIDLNRSEREIDPEMIDPPLRGAALDVSRKVRGGLGLVPRRLHPHGDIWKDRLAVETLSQRIRDVHRPYHDRLSQLLALARDRFGSAILIDLHSMPPIRDNGDSPPRVVIGDRFGRSAAARLTARAVAEAREAGFAAAINTPYSGGHILERHSAPQQAIHAVQIEVDRSLYLAPGLREPGDSLPRIAAFIARMTAALAEEGLNRPTAIAAE